MRSQTGRVRATRSPPRRPGPDRRTGAHGLQRRGPGRSPGRARPPRHARPRRARPDAGVAASRRCWRAGSRRRGAWPSCPAATPWSASATPRGSCASRPRAARPSRCARVPGGAAGRRGRAARPRGEPVVAADDLVYAYVTAADDNRVVRFAARRRPHRGRCSTGIPQGHDPQRRPARLRPGRHALRRHRRRRRHAARAGPGRASAARSCG